MITEIKLVVSGGSDLEDAITTAKSLAIDHHCDVKFEFNSVEVVISPSGATKYTTNEISSRFFEEYNRPRKVTI